MALAAAVTVLIAASFMWLRICIFYVAGVSMEPSICSGSLVVAQGLRGQHWDLEVGEVYVFMSGDDLMVKRLVATSVATAEDSALRRDGYIMIGDNVTESYDSRNYGPVERQNVLARVLYAINPLGAVRRYFRGAC